MLVLLTENTLLKSLNENQEKQMLSLMKLGEIKLYSKA